MGIPAFYRWLVDKYPLAVADVIEEAPTIVNGVSMPLDSSRPNPNDIEFDNLYLDMNGIIHPCFHPEGLPAPKTYEEVFEAVFKYIDRVFSIVRPRKLLYMAIDGVAPRAKMNQQRARRFRAAKDAADEASRTEGLSGVHGAEGEDLALLEQTKKLDSNVITPGTEFMSLLSSALQYYVHLRMNMDPGWRGVKVILSDANVPGEGEHKIMSYIRLQRNLPGFDPNTRHCLYGLDADLIMLALATHEIHFSILREDVRKENTNDNSRRDRKKMSRQKQREESEQGCSGKYIQDYSMRLKFQFLHVWILRDYLVHDLRIPDPTAKADLERLIDDFVFMCLFVGNDFLPHVPSLEISEGAIDLLMVVYKKEFIQMGGYLTNSVEVNLERVEHFVQAVGCHEDAIFRKRSQVQKEREIWFRRSSRPVLEERKTWSQHGRSSRSCVKKMQSSVNCATDDANPVIDQVKLGEEGWKERFYAEKFEAKTDDDREKIRRHSVLKYIEGICWVMHYYYEGVCSWQWFYPYHYAPFASDFYGLDQLEIYFTLGKPFKPFDQLMGVLPAASAHALPFFYRKLMTDSSSPILDFYPDDFELDMDGKRFAWQAICKLPFIKESRLLSEIVKVEHTLTDEEKRRNGLGMDVLFIHKSHSLALKIFSFYEKNKDHPKLLEAKVKRKIDPELSGGMNGYIYISDKPVCPLEINPPIGDMVMIMKNEVLSVFYKYPSFHSHIPKPPEGVTVPEKAVKKRDVLPSPVLWHEKSSLLGRIVPKRPPIPESVSGHSLAKLAHQLVCKYYLAKQPVSHGYMKVGNHGGVDDPTCQSNLKATVCGKELDGGSENCITTESRKRKRNRGSRRSNKLGNQIGVDDPTCQSNLKATVCGKELDGGSENCTAIDSKKRKRNRDRRLRRIKKRKLMSKTNIEVKRELNGGSNNGSLTNLEVKGEEFNGEEVGNHIGVDGPSCQSNLKATVCGKELDGGSENCIIAESRKRKRKRGSRRRNKLGNQIGVDDPTCQLNLKATVCGKELDGEVENNHVGVVDPTCQSNMKATVCGKELDGEVKNNHVGVDDPTCQSNLKATVCGKELDGEVENNHVGVDDRTCQSNMKATVCGKELDGEVKNNHVGVDDPTCQSNLKATVCGKELDGVIENCTAMILKTSYRTEITDFA
ncbi:unnamed protein product [Camellia sinensis]